MTDHFETKYPSLSEIHLDLHHASCLNPKLAKSYIPITSAALTLSKGASSVSNVMQHVNKVSLPISIATDTFRIRSAMYDDYQHGEVKESLKTGASIAGAWAGGYFGGSGGMSSGGALGASIGGLFGAIGAVPGAAVGSLLGGIIGSICGSIAGSLTAEKLASNPICNNRDDLVIVDPIDYMEQNEKIKGDYDHLDEDIDINI